MNDVTLKSPEELQFAAQLKTFSSAADIRNSLENYSIDLSNKFRNLFGNNVSGRMTYMIWTLEQLIYFLTHEWINPNPIGQRGEEGDKQKPFDVCKALVDLGTGMLTFRWIANDARLKKIYPGYHFTTIDGGHRCRYLLRWIAGKLLIDGMRFNEFCETMEIDISKIFVPVQVAECDDYTATFLFRQLNKGTKVSPMNMIMADDVSSFLANIRSTVKKVEEYGNDVKEVFDYYPGDDGKNKSLHWSTEWNPSGKWFEYAAVVAMKAYHRSHIAAGYKDIESFVEEGTLLSKKDNEIVDQFWSDFMRIRLETGMKHNNSSFEFFQILFFGLLEEVGPFKIKYWSKFKDTYEFSRSILTGKATNLDRETTTFNKIVSFVKEWFRSNGKAFSNPEKQKHCYELIKKYSTLDCDELKDVDPNSNEFLTRFVEEFGIVMLDPKRSLQRDERYDVLVHQGFRCAIDGKPLTIDDSDWAHDDDYDGGGRTTRENGAVVRRCYNRKFGHCTIAEVISILVTRGELPQERLASVS